MNYYEELGVSPDASADEIRSAGRRLLYEFHDDRHQGKSESERKFFHERTVRIIQALHVLRDPDRRAQYDAARQAHTPRARPRVEIRLVELGSVAPGMRSKVVEIGIFAVDSKPVTPIKLSTVQASYWRVSEIDPVGEEILRLAVQAIIPLGTSPQSSRGSICVEFDGSSETIEVVVHIVALPPRNASVPHRPAGRPVSSRSSADRAKRDNQIRALQTQIDQLEESQSWRCLWLLAVPIGWPGILSILLLPVHDAVPRGSLYITIPLFLVGVAALIVLAANQFEIEERLNGLELELDQLNGP